MIFQLVKVAVGILMGMVLCACASAQGHSWYSPQCCGGADCRPVPNGVVEELKDGVRVRGFPMLSYSDPRLHWSEDDQDHVCSRGQSLFCIYRRPKEF